MSVHVSYIVAADLAFFSEDKKLNIVNVFDRIVVKKLPSVHSKMSIAVGLLGDISLQKPFFEIVSPSGEVILSREIDPKGYDSAKERTQMVFTLVGFPVKEKGKYVFNVRVGNEIMNPGELDFITVTVE